MRTSYLVLMMIAVAFLLGSCSTTGTTRLASNYIQRQNIESTTQEVYPPKDPQHIALFSKEKSPHAAYRIIAIATVHKHNILGLERKEETLNEMMKQLAASIGGDGLIDVSSEHDALKAKVIAFQKILI